MSFVIIPSNTYGQRSAAAPSFSRCGPSLSPFDYHRSNTAIPRDFLGALFGDQDEDVIFDEAPSLTPWQEIHLEQLRRQEYLEQVERRRRRIQEARQKQIELERRIEQTRREKEKAARLAWHQEQQRKAALALEYRRRLEAHKRRQQEEYAQQVRLAQQEYLARQAEQARETRHVEQAARLAQQSQQKEVDWEQLATQSIFGVLDLVQHLFGDEEDKSHSKIDGKKREKTTEEVNAEQAKQRDVDAMQVDQPEVVIKLNNVEHGAEADKAVDPEQASKEVADIQGETIEVKAQEEQATVVSPEDQLKAGQEQESKAGHLVFTYPLPQDEAAHSSIKAQDIGVSYDEASHTIQLTGLWFNDSASGTSSSSHEESRGRTRSRSPKRSRVSDVDEKTGEEIVKADENDEGFVEVPKVQQATTTTTTPNTTTKSIRLPQDATVTNLRAELTDDGFKVFV